MSLSRAAQIMHEFMGQVDMRSVVLCVRDCLSVLLDASIDTAAQADRDPTSSQPWSGWDGVTCFPLFTNCITNHPPWQQAMLSAAQQA